MNKIVFSHKSDDWKTPKVLYDYIMSCGYKDLFEYCSLSDQYENTSYYNDYLFINPPYSHLNTTKFKNFMYKLINRENHILLLIPSRTDTKIFQYLFQWCKTIYFFKGRLHFNEGSSAPFPSCLMVLEYSWYLYPTFAETCTVEGFIKNGFANSKN